MQTFEVSLDGRERKTKSMAASSIITLDKRRVKKNGNYPVKLRVSYRGTTRDFQTIFDLNLEDYKKLNTPRLNNELRKINGQLQELQAKAGNLCRQMRGFTFAKFELEIYAGEHCLKEKKRGSQPFTLLAKELDLEPYRKRFKILSEIHPGKDYISYTFSEHIQNLLKQERMGTALGYQDAYYCLKRFGDNVRFEEIDVTYLVRFEKWMLAKDTSKATIGIKLRCLRTIFNEAIFRKIIRKEDCYPFGRRLYMLPTASKTKKSLDLEDVAKIFSYRTTNQWIEKARDYWVFCYLGNGMNPKDMMYLKNKNVDGDFINFERAKTERTGRGNPIVISVFITPEMRYIMEKWGNKEQETNNYIFPIMKPNLNMLEKHDRLVRFRAFINDHIKIVAREVGINKKVTNVVSRHTFSTILLRSGVPTSYIKDSLGHSNIMTTENYLSGFEDKAKKEFAQILTAFQPNLNYPIYELSNHSTENI